MFCETGFISISIIFTMPQYSCGIYKFFIQVIDMNNAEIRSYDQHLTEILAGIYGFEPHRHTVWSMQDPESVRTLDMVGAGSNGIDCMQYEFTGRSIVNTDRGEITYKTVVPVCEEKHCLFLLAEGIAVGEHAAAHIVSGDIEEYTERFHIPLRAMISNLGAHLAYFRLMREPSDFPCEPNMTTEQSMLFSIGYRFAHELLNTYEMQPEVPLKEVFGAESHQEAWSLLNDNLGAPLLLDIGSVPEDLYETFIIALEQTGLEVDVTDAASPTGKQDILSERYWLN